MYNILNNFFIKIFPRKKNKKIITLNNCNLSTSNKEKNKMTNNIIQKTFDIIVIDYDDNGKQVQTPQNGIKASSAAELANLYKRCGQDIKILREYGNNGDEQNLVESPVLKEPGIRPEQTTDFGQTINQTFNQQFPPIAKRIDATPAKFFNVGGIECKLENNKIYQKQWVKVIGADAQNYRIIQDSNNKEVSLTGKHLEMLKWVLIEDDNAVETRDKILSIVNG